MRWSGSTPAAYVDIHTSDWSPPGAGINRQRYLTNCLDTYNGKAQPMWTNMIEGEDRACILAYRQNLTGETIFTANHGVVGDTACA